MTRRSTLRTSTSHESAGSFPRIEILLPCADRAQIDDLIHLARLLDNRFVVPGTNFRFGVDALIGLIPGIGDGLSALISLYIIARAKHLGAPDKLIFKMGVNVAIDTAIGAFPVFGDLFDAAYKSNLRNVRLLLEHLGIEEDGVTRPHRRPHRRA